jgi:hypothetical protein
MEAWSRVHSRVKWRVGRKTEHFCNITSRDFVTWRIVDADEIDQRQSFASMFHRFFFETTLFVFGSTDTDKEDLAGKYNDTFACG